MWDSFFIYVAFNLMIFGAVIMSYGLFTESKKNPDSKKFHLFGSLFFLSMWLLVIWMQFWGGLGESGSITIITQFTLISILIFDIKINEHRILNFFGKFVDMFNNTIEVTLPRLFRNVLLYSTIILAFFAVVFLIVKLVKYFWYL
jgi:hypothetical protein